MKPNFALTGFILLGGEYLNCILRVVLFSYVLLVSNERNRFWHSILFKHRVVAYAPKPISLFLLLDGMSAVQSIETGKQRRKLNCIFFVVAQVLLAGPRPWKETTLPPNGLHAIEKLIEQLRERFQLFKLSHENEHKDITIAEPSPSIAFVKPIYSSKSGNSMISPFPAIISACILSHAFICLV